MNSLKNLTLASRKTAPMPQVVETYFVETHEYNIDTNNRDLMEYWDYESGAYESTSKSGIESPVHHTTLSLAII